MDSLFAFFRLRCWNLVLVEFDVIQCALEVFARVEAGQHRVDLVSAHFFTGYHTFCGGPQPEAAEITQFHDVTLRQFLRDNGEEGLQSGDDVCGGERGHLRSLLRQFAQGQATTGLDGGVELPGRLGVGGVAALDDIKFY